MERFTQRDGKGRAVCRAETRYSLVHCTEIVGGEPIERLAELEDKLESGQLVELPFKVGEKVYLVRRNRNWDLVVSRTKIDMYCFHWRLLVKCSCDSSWHEPKNIFSDKTQADARLKELQEKMK